MPLGSVAHRPHIALMPVSLFLKLIAAVLMAAFLTTVLVAFVMPAGVGPQAVVVVTLSAAVGLFYLRKHTSDDS